MSLEFGGHEQSIHINEKRAQALTELALKILQRSDREANFKSIEMLPTYEWRVYIEINGTSYEVDITSDEIPEL